MSATPSIILFRRISLPFSIAIAIITRFRISLPFPLAVTWVCFPVLGPNLGENAHLILRSLLLFLQLPLQLVFPFLFVDRNLQLPLKLFLLRQCLPLLLLLLKLCCRCLVWQFRGQIPILMPKLFLLTPNLLLLGFHVV